MPLSTAEMPNLQHLCQTLEAFASSPQTFQILRTLPSISASATKKPKRLYILDSSFNPPTRAHLDICTSALRSYHSSPKRILLLLATQNADKPAKPASFEQRVAMMEVFGGELLDSFSRSEDRGSAREGEEDVVVDIGVTKEARFVDKMGVLEECEEYAGFDGVGEVEDLGKDSEKRKRRPAEQVHLTGFDTLIRLLDVKYYPPEHNLKALEGLFENHRVRVTRRVNDTWGGREAQDEYLNNLKQGGREHEGGRREWADKIDLVDGRKEGEESISSTKVRDAARAGHEAFLKQLVTDGVAKWILNEKFYLE